MSFREEQYYASSKESFIKLEKDFKSHEGVDFNEYSSEEDLKKHYRYPVISVKGEIKISFFDYS